LRATRTEQSLQVLRVEERAGAIMPLRAFQRRVASSGLSLTAARIARTCGGNGVKRAAAMFSA
jgi:hypothetical protein